MKNLQIADLFCGAGGTSRGAMDAIELMGLRADLTAINHWPVAIASHTLNHPEARHLCTGIDAVNPLHLYKPGELNLLWASPACTHFSTARGDTPVNDQSRATAWCVIRWAEALRPPIILLENVPEFQSWGPLLEVDVRRKYKRILAPGEEPAEGETLIVRPGPLRPRARRRVYGYTTEIGFKPDKERKGETFAAWKLSLESIGYLVEHRVLCCANFGDPTKRKRLFIQAVRRGSGLRVTWPNDLHAESPHWHQKIRPWKTTRDHVINWKHKGKPVFDRKKPLAQNTLKRIVAGLTRQGLEPFILPQHTSHPAKSTGAPLGAVTTTSRGINLVTPFILAMEHGGSLDNVDEPLRTVTTAKGGAFAVAEPYVLPGFGEREGQKPRTHAIDQAFPTVCGGGHFHLAEPQVIELRGTAKRQIQASSRGTGEPLGVVSTSGAHHGLAEFMVQVAHGNGKDPNGNRRRVKSLDNPTPTICGNRGDLALIEAYTLGQQSGAVPRPAGEPLATVAGGGAISFVEPYVVKFYGTANDAPINQPLDTVTTKDRFGVADARAVEEIRVTVDSVVTIGEHTYPLVNHEGTHCLLCVKDGRLLVVGILFRMLTPRELAKAQGFRSDHKFSGTKTEIVKQIGNAVPYHTARALVLAALSQDPDVSKFLKAEYGEVAA